MKRPSKRRGEPGPASARRGLSSRELRRRWWTGSWRAALRLARRDALRNKASSLLIVVMVGLPVLLITGASAFLATRDVTVQESLPVLLGNAQARLEDNQSGPLTQNAVGEFTPDQNPSSAPQVPGHAAGQPWTADQLQRVTGGALAQLAYPDLYAGTGSGLLRARALAMDTAAMRGSGLVTLVSGRWPQGNEVAVTEAGTKAGLPSSGPLSLRAGSASPSTVQVAGVVRAVGADYVRVDLVAGSAWLPREGTGLFLLTRDRPVSWDDVKAWNRYGLVAVSKAVLADPPAEAPAAQEETGGDAGVAIVVLICFGLVLETTLLAGPAFAVSAARQRRSLTLVASNGADRDQLTRYVLAQGVVLGGGAVVLGCLLGISAGWTAVRVAAHWVPAIGHPPLDTFAALTALVAAAAVLASLVAAALPARGAARLALAATLDSHGELRQSSKRLPLAAALVLVAGAAGVGSSLLMSSSMAKLLLAGVAGAVTLLGALLLVPVLLRLLGAGLRRGPVTLRMAARDASRARTRSTPAIAAVTVAVAVMTVASVSATSDDAQSRRDYDPNAAPGQARVFGGGPEEVAGQATVAEIRRQHPDWQVEPVGSVGAGMFGQRPGTYPLLAAVPPGCRTAAAIAAPAEDDPSHSDHCRTLSSEEGGIYSLPLATMNPDVALTPAQRRVLSDGGLLVTSAALVSHGRVRLALGTVRLPKGDHRTVTRVVELPAALMDPATMQAASYSWNSYTAGALMLPSGVQRLGLPVNTGQWAVIKPAGPISRSDEDKINRHVQSEMQVERGYESPIVLVVRVLLALAAVLVALAALISTALAQAEARPDFATMSALGATTSFRRRLAGGQALLVSLTGAVLGLAVGLLPGLSMALSLTSESYSGAATTDSPTLPGVIDIPWLGLAAVVVGVPLLAALVAAGAVRPNPVMTRRLT